MMDCTFRFDPNETIKEYRKSGWKLIGHFCSYTPEELFYSNKILPIRIFPDFPGNYDLADKYFPAYTCSFGRSSLNSLLANKFEYFDGFFFSSNCDTIRFLLYHFKKRHPNKFIPYFTLPTKAYAKCSKELLLTELEKLQEEICIYSGGLYENNIGDVVKLYRENRALIREIVGLRIKSPGIISARTMNEIYRYNMWIDKESANKKLMEFIKIIQSNDRVVDDKPKVFILGNCCGNNTLIELIEDCGSYVVNDLLGSGNKYFQDVEEQSRPLDYIATRMNERIICPTKIITYLVERKNMLDQIENEIRTSEAEAIILLSQKFCDPHGLDRPLLMPKLKEMGLHILELESEQDINNPEQLKNRIEAFIEMIH